MTCGHDCALVKLREIDPADADRIERVLSRKLERRRRRLPEFSARVDFVTALQRAALSGTMIDGCYTLRVSDIATILYGIPSTHGSRVWQSRRVCALARERDLAVRRPSNASFILCDNAYQRVAGSRRMPVRP